MVGVPMLKAERISCSGPKLSDAQTRNFEAIKHNWTGVTLEEFMDMLDAYLRWYRDVRIKGDLDYRSPMQYRRDLGLAAKDELGPRFAPQSLPLKSY